MSVRIGSFLGAGVAVLSSAGLALANDPAKAADYSGISYIYYTVIFVILAYGVYDTFLKKS
jgi:hypothetical protein